LPKLDGYVERDNMTASRGSINSPPTVVGETVVFLNAWYGDGSMVWPPPIFLSPVLNALHMEAAVAQKFGSGEAKAYYEQHGVLGAKDTSTLSFFQSLGVSAELSGCMTFTLQKAPWKPRHGIYVVDIGNLDLVRLGFPKHVVNDSKILSHKYIGSDRFDMHVRFSHAFELLQKYRTAKLVITSRLHVALPCVAMGTPVVFLKHKGMMGGNDPKHDRIDPNFMQLFHGVNLTGGDSRRNRFEGFDFVHQVRNPRSSSIRHMRANLFKTICKTPYLAEYFLMFATQEDRDDMMVATACSGVLHGITAD